MTSESGTLRFESFSGCCGVHARFDIDPAGLDAEAMAPGTVNVDFNEPMRTQLARVLARSPLRLQVGFDAVEVQTLEGSAVERRVPLPDCWVKGFSEVQVAAAGLAPALETLAIEAEFLDRALHGVWRFGDEDLARTGLDAARGRRALSWLGARGRIGYDPVQDVWFRRELPCPSAPTPP